MGDNSQIEWTDDTWNPFTGCTKISPGCANCYISRTPPFRIAGRRFDAQGHIPLVIHENRFNWPLTKQTPRRIFVNSLSDIFHEDIPFETIERLYMTMHLAGWHRFQVLTKREARAAAFYDELRAHWADSVGMGPGFVDALAHVWIGMTCENRYWLERRGFWLRQIPARVRFLSLEPLLEDVSGPLETLLARGGIHWVISGFESGAKRRPMVIEPHHHEWIRRIDRACQAHGVAHLFKQWGGPTPKSGGRVLDGRTIDGFPA